jgi:uncharacterized cupredoxin-like copper-binding protein
VAGFLAAVLLVAAPGSPARSGAAGQSVTVTMTEFKFTPAEVTLRAGVPAEIRVVNTGATEHEFMVYERPKAGATAMDLHDWSRERSYFLGLEPKVDGSVTDVERKGKDIVMIMLAAGKSATIKFTPKKTGTFEIGCLVPGHREAGMRAVLVVR